MNRFMVQKILKHLNSIHNSIWTDLINSKGKNGAKRTYADCLWNYIVENLRLEMSKSYSFFLVQAVRLRLKWVRKLNENVPTTELRLNKCESVCGEGTHLVFIEMFANSVLFSNSLLFVYQLETRFYWGRYNHIRCYLV